MLMLMPLTGGGTEWLNVEINPRPVNDIALVPQPDTRRPQGRLEADIRV